MRGEEQLINVRHDQLIRAWHMLLMIQRQLSASCSHNDHSTGEV